MSLFKTAGALLTAFAVTQAAQAQTPSSSPERGEYTPYNPVIKARMTTEGIVITGIPKMIWVDPVDEQDFVPIYRHNYEPELGLKYGYIHENFLDVTLFDGHDFNWGIYNFGGAVLDYDENEHRVLKSAFVMDLIPGEDYQIVVQPHSENDLDDSHTFHSTLEPAVYNFKFDRRDYNCDGLVDMTDIVDFIQDFHNNSPTISHEGVHEVYLNGFSLAESTAIDYNGSGVWDNQDIIDFITNFNAYTP